jgi:hypothetical protein
MAGLKGRFLVTCVARVPCGQQVNKRFNFLRNHTPKPMTGAEAVASGAVMTAIDTGEA